MMRNALTDMSCLVLFGACQAAAGFCYTEEEEEEGDDDDDDEVRWLCPHH
jgi:hypothetical protein